MLCLPGAPLPSYAFAMKLLSASNKRRTNHTGVGVIRVRKS